MRVSLIATVLNEGDSIRPLLESIASQTRQPDEIVICDGGSTDRTIDVLESYADRLPLRVVVRPGANISEGRNTAIAEARHGIIAVTDAGVRLHPHWLERIVAPLENAPETHVVAGFFLPDTRSPFEVAMGATVLPELRDIDPARFMPSSRSVAFRRSAVEAVGGYPEWLDFCEDLILDFRLSARCGPFAFAPGAIAYFRPRPTLRAFWKQYYQYARGDGKANLFAERHLVRYATYLVAAPLLLALAILRSPWWLLGLAAGGAAMFRMPYRRLQNQWHGLGGRGKLIAALWVPVIRVVGDVAKMAGYPAGLRWRLRNRPPDWRLAPSRSDVQT